MINLNSPWLSDHLFPHFQIFERQFAHLRGSLPAKNSIFFYHSSSFFEQDLEDSAVPFRL